MKHSRCAAGSYQVHHSFCLGFCFCFCFGFFAGNAFSFCFCPGFCFGFGFGFHFLVNRFLPESGRSKSQT